MNVEKPSREFSVGEILTRAFDLYLSNFWQFFFPFLIQGVIIGISTYVITSSFPTPTPPSATSSYEELIAWFFALISTTIVVGILSALVLWIVGTMITGVAIKNASDQIEKGSSNLSVSFSFTMSKLPSLLVAQFVAGILIGIGMLCLIVPGIIIAVMFSLVFPAIIVEQRGTFESLGRSRKLVSNRWLKTFLLLLILGIIVLIINGIANAITTPLNTIHPIANPLITNILSAFVNPIYPIVITYLYYAMVTRENPHTPPLPTPPPTL